MIMYLLGSSAIASLEPTTRNYSVKFLQRSHLIFIIYSTLIDILPSECLVLQDWCLQMRARGAVSLLYANAVDFTGTR